jgi:Ran GTPase-activating protein (RanGAP) involved in mRNA processing and transport
MRKIVGHPILPGEQVEAGKMKPKIDFCNSPLNEFSLKYLAKFIFEHDVNTLAINGASAGGFMPLNDIKLNNIVHLTMSECGLHSEDLYVLAQHLKQNTSITSINLSKNNIGFKYIDETKQIEIKMKNQAKLKDFSYQEEFYNSLGLEHFSIALSDTDRLKHLNLSENDLGVRNFAVLQPIFACNTSIETLNLADCKIDGAETAKLGANLQKNVCLRELYLRNCQIGDEGAAAIAQLVGEHPAMTDLELFNCGISAKGGTALGNSLKTNFRIQKLSIGENVLDVKDVEQI